MEKSKVYYTDFHTRKLGEGLPTKLQLLAKKAGIAELDLDGKFVAIKMHFGELGNIAYLCTCHCGRGKRIRRKTILDRL